jgi:hypothetical protein
MSDNEGRYYPGTQPLPDEVFLVETVDYEKQKFVALGKVRVSGGKVAAEMRAHLSIKGYEAGDIAKRIAEKRFAKQLRISSHLQKPVILTRITEAKTQ